MKFLLSIIEFFRFFKHLRERRAARERLDREHQLALVTQLVHGLEVIAESSTRQAEENTKALSDIAKGVIAQAESFNSWIKSFQITSAPDTSVVRDEDELASEHQRFAESLGLPALPSEFALAHELQQGFLKAVRDDMHI